MKFKVYSTSSRFIFFFLLLVIAKTSSGLVLEEMIADNTLEKTLSNKRVGYYFGSFDPIHFSHADIAERAIEENAADYVLFSLAWGSDRHKKRAPTEHRLNMLYLAFQNHPQIIVTKLNPQEMQGVLTEPKPANALDSHIKVQAKYNIQWFGVIGSDNAIKFSHYKGMSENWLTGHQIQDKYAKSAKGSYQAIPVQAFILNGRKGYDPTMLNNKFAGRDIAHITYEKKYSISSTSVRQAIREDKYIGFMVPPKVADYIHTHRLYRD